MFEYIPVLCLLLIKLFYEVHILLLIDIFELVMFLLLLLLDLV